MLNQLVWRHFLSWSLSAVAIRKIAHLNKAQALSLSPSTPAIWLQHFASLLLMEFDTVQADMDDFSCRLQQLGMLLCWLEFEDICHLWCVFDHEFPVNFSEPICCVNWLISFLADTFYIWTRQISPPKAAWESQGNGNWGESNWKGWWIAQVKAYENSYSYSSTVKFISTWFYIHSTVDRRKEVHSKSLALPVGTSGCSLVAHQPGCQVHDILKGDHLSWTHLDMWCLGRSCFFLYFAFSQLPQKWICCWLALSPA